MSLAESYDKANIFLGLIDYELNSLLGASHLVDYMSVHVRFDLERYLLIISKINILGGNNKTVVWSAACPISDLFGKGQPILGSAYASPNIGFLLLNKSDIGQQPTK